MYCTPPLFQFKSFSLFLSPHAPVQSSCPSLLCAAGRFVRCGYTGDTVHLSTHFRPCLCSGSSVEDGGVETLDLMLSVTARLWKGQFCHYICIFPDKVGNIPCQRSCDGTRELCGTLLASPGKSVLFAAETVLFPFTQI